MSSLEDKCQKILDHLREEKWKPIRVWKFNKKSHRDFALLSSKGRMVVGCVHQLIEEAPEGECLTSPCRYVRKYREWYENERKTNSSN